MVKPVDYAALTERRCSACGETKPVAEFNRYTDPKAKLTGWRYYSRCRICQNEGARRYGAENKPRRNDRLRQWRKDNPGRAAALDRRRRIKRYGLTLAQIDEMLARHAGQCWVCRRRAAVLVEHHHGTGKVRGMTCHTCNGVLAKVDADPKFLAQLRTYLREAAA